MNAIEWIRDFQRKTGASLEAAQQSYDYHKAITRHAHLTQTTPALLAACKALVAEVVTKRSECRLCWLWDTHSHWCPVPGAEAAIRAAEGGDDGRVQRVQQESQRD